jgi:hypothetical protein
MKMWQFRIQARNHVDGEWFMFADDEYFGTYDEALKQMEREKEVDKVVDSEFSFDFEYRIQARRISKWMNVEIAKKKKKGKK